MLESIDGMALLVAREIVELYSERLAPPPLRSPGAASRRLGPAADRWPVCRPGCLGAREGREDMSTNVIPCQARRPGARYAIDLSGQSVLYDFA